MKARLTIQVFESKLDSCIPTLVISAVPKVSFMPGTCPLHVHRTASKCKRTAQLLTCTMVHTGGRSLMWQTHSNFLPFFFFPSPVLKQTGQEQLCLISMHDGQSLHQTADPRHLSLCLKGIQSYFPGKGPGHPPTGCCGWVCGFHPSC